MARQYGVTNNAPYASAPAVGLAGDTYYNTATKTLYISDGTTWLPVGNMDSPGVVKLFGGPAAPAGFLMCNGAAVNRVTYVDLFNVIGTAYGVGDNSTTFNVPDYNIANRFPRGGSPGVVAGALTHDHTSAAHLHALTGNGSALIMMGTTQLVMAASAINGVPNPNFRVAATGYARTAATGSDAATSAANLAGNTESATPANVGSSTFMPPHQGINFIIKT